jgi:hypothetical protein
MGRMLDVLCQAETRRDDGAAAGAPAEEDFVSDFANEEVPFIEVGPARSLEASSGVLAARPPQLRIAPQPQPDAGPVLHLPPDAGPAVGVCLRPLSGGLALLPPEQRFAADLIAFHQPDHPAGADYRQLAAAIQDGTTPGQSRVLLCLGASQGVGTTSVVLNLAICLAAGGECASSWLMPTRCGRPWPSGWACAARRGWRKSWRAANRLTGRFRKRVCRA